ncbi:MAG: hypothetical protein LIP05_16330 [Tannerellaceae bacterium]|nr:hypothetical protein [Tannerellaceae bacterium]
MKSSKALVVDWGDGTIEKIDTTMQGHVFHAYNYCQEATLPPLIIN